MTRAGHVPKSPGRISAVQAGSVAARADLRAGDELLVINKHSVRDLIDVRYYASEASLNLLIRRGGVERVIEVERRYQDYLGLEFEEPVFDGVHRCSNRCEFCFVAQMPGDLRPSLYMRDDDYRYSFLFGSYITLTNLTESDWERIAEQHLSPLYVSVHATETDLRRRLLQNPAASDVTIQLGRLAELGVETHTQIVVLPGCNDGIHLDRSISDLAGLYPAVRSVSIVPVGLTKYHRSGCRLHTEAEMRVVVEQVSAWQARLRDALGIDFAYLSDEWYLRLGEALPRAERYDALDLTENGVGLVRHFLGSERYTLRSLVSDLCCPSLVTGTLFAPILRSAVAGSSTEVIPVINRFLGESVTVAGLMAAEDVIDRLKDRNRVGPVILPPAMFGGPEGQSLDGLWPADVQEALGRTVIVPAIPDGYGPQGAASADPGGGLGL